MKNISLEVNSYTIRLLTLNDIEEYYKTVFQESDDETMFYTGTTKKYAKKQIITYVERVVTDPTRMDFVIVENNKIIAEVVISDITEKKCHYRICIFKKENYSKGIGYKVTKAIFNILFKDFAIEEIKLEVFPFNERGISLYQKLGFRIIKKDRDEAAASPYKDIYVMKLVKSNYNE